MKKSVILLSLTAILLISFSGMAFGQEAEKMKMDEYKAQLADWETRQTDASAQQATLEADIEALKADIDSVQTEIDAEWEAIFALLGTDKATYDAYNADLDAMASEMDGLAALSPEELFERRDEIDAIAEKIEAAKTSDFTILADVQDKLAALDAQMAALNAKLPANMYDQYTVVNGDYLWKISKKDDIYGDPMQWISIYSVNKDQIKDPNLIYADQVLNIARGVGKDQYQIQKGEFLQKIAGYSQVLNDPAQWTKLYEANKDLIEDPNLVYPYQILAIPQD